MKGGIVLRMFVRAIAILSLGVGAVGASLLPATAQPAGDEVALGQQATLIARGAAIDVPVTYTCALDGFVVGFVELFVIEGLPGGEVVQGTGSSEVVCDGSQHLTSVRVVSSSGITFRKGTALVQGYLVACDAANPCARTFLSDTIMIDRK